MSHHLILDTDALIAGLRSGRGASFARLDRLDAGEFEINVSVPLIL